MEAKKINIDEFIKAHQSKRLLKFITCGSVDDGKSTLIGRLLYDTRMIFEDQLSQAKSESKKYGTVKDEELDFALLVDGLQSEKQQGITIDVAYRYFSTEKKKYIIADTPGHEQYTRNTVTGASNADLAVILIDARKGVLTQTRRHSFLVTLLGIRYIVVTVNKMDLVGYSRDVFERIVSDYQRMFKSLKFCLPYKNFTPTVRFIPISALKGDNVAKRSSNMGWYDGPSLLEYLDSVDLSEDEISESFFRFPVQYVNRAALDFRGYCGTIAAGTISVGDEVVIYPSQRTTRVSEIVLPVNSIDRKNVDDKASRASSPMAVTLRFTDELDINRGDLVVKKESRSPYFGDSFEAMLVWMDEEPLATREYIIRLYTAETDATISRILFKRDVNTWEKIETKTLNLNDIARVKIDLAQKVAFDLYEVSKSTGAFILIDRLTNNTVAAGMIVGEATKSARKRVYTPAEIALNRFIREHFPEWGCKSIDEL